MGHRRQDRRHVEHDARLTYNTDFAQVEVDEQQINLTRFNLLFPEKRPFFLENRGLFAVGRPGEIDLFFSRRIGIDDNGVLIPIQGGARLSGKASGVNVGVLNMQTERVGGTPANNFTAARVNKDLRTARAWARYSSTEPRPAAWRAMTTGTGRLAWTASWASATPSR